MRGCDIVANRGAVLSLMFLFCVAVCFIANMQGVDDGAQAAGLDEFFINTYPSFTVMKGLSLCVCLSHL